MRACVCREWARQATESSPLLHHDSGGITLVSPPPASTVDGDNGRDPRCPPVHSRSGDVTEKGRALHLWCYSVVTVLLQCCYSVVTVLLQCCYSVVTVLLQCCYSVVTVLLQSCYSVVTVLLQCCYSVVTVLLQCSHLHSLEGVAMDGCRKSGRAVTMGRGGPAM
jgi:hypothetical protein